MKRAVVLGVLVAAGALSIAVAAFQADQTAPVTIEKLRENLYLLPDGGGNTAAFIRSDGVVVVDTKNPGRGKDILAKVNEVTNKPVTMIINTHTHSDHVSGNVEFPPTVDVVVQENTNVDTIISGHNRVMTSSDLREYIQFVKDFVAYTEAAMKAGKTVDEATDGYKIDESKYKDGYEILPGTVKTGVQVIYNELKK